MQTKFRRYYNVITLPKAGNVYNEGLWEILYPLSDFNEIKFRLRFRLKPSNDRGEFELDRAKSKNDIAENSFALGHEKHHRYLLIML